MSAKKKKRTNGHVEAAPEPQIVPIVLGGKTRHLRLDFNALAIIEDRTGVNILDPNALTDNLTVKKTRSIMYALLKHEDAELTEEDVGAWLHPGNLAHMVAKLTEAVSAGTTPPKANG